MYTLQQLQESLFTHNNLTTTLLCKTVYSTNTPSPL